MANKIKENNTLYIRRCKHCKSLFGYTNLEWAKDDYYYDKGTIKCPYCNNKNKIRFKIRYKSVKKIEAFYRNLDVKEYPKYLKEWYKKHIFKIFCFGLLNLVVFQVLL